MTNPTLTNAPAQPAGEVGRLADAILADLRGRKLLKYLFAADPEHSGAYGYVEEPLDLETQIECVTTWAKLARTSQAQDVEEAFGYPVEGIGASFNRDSDSWGLYTMPGIRPFATVQGYSPKRLDWVVAALRAALTKQPAQDVTQAMLEQFDAHWLAISHRRPSAKRDELLSELQTIRNSMCRATAVDPAPQPAQDVGALVEALGKATAFSAYRASDPLAIRFEFATEKDRLSAANAVDAAFLLGVHGIDAALNPESSHDQR